MDTEAQQQRITVTHPFSPFSGKELVLIGKVNTSVGERLVCIDDAGNSLQLQASWTNSAAHNIDRTLLEGAGLRNSDFKFEDLEALRRMLADIKRV